MDALVRVGAQQRECLASFRFGQGLRAQVARSDRVGLVDDGRTALLVASDRERQPECEDQATSPSSAA